MKKVIITNEEISLPNIEFSEGCNWIDFSDGELIAGSDYCGVIKLTKEETKRLFEVIKKYYEISKL